MSFVTGSSQAQRSCKDLTKLDAAGVDQAVKDAVTRRFALKAAARHLLPLERVAGCCRWLQGGVDGVDVWHIPEHKRAKLTGLQTCGSVWMCPVCAAKITERRRIEVAAGLEAARAQGWTPLLVTYTVQHYAQDGLRTLLDGLSKARSRASGGRAAMALRAACGVRGHIRAVEVTHTANGWHPHIHELLFVDNEKAIGDLQKGLESQWAQAVRLAGLRDVNDHGLRLSLTDEDIALYVAKFGREPVWQVQHELTKHPAKVGRSQVSRTPMQLLADYMAGDQPAGAIWSDYARNMKGCRWLVWSRGLRDLLGLGVELTDQQVAEEVTADALHLAKLSLPDWRLVLGHEAEADLLNVAASGNPAEIQAFIAALELSPLARRVRWSAPGRHSPDNRTTLEQEEARGLGLTWSQYRMWQRGGLAAIAEGREDAQRASVASTARPRRTRQRREVIPCEFSDSTDSQMALC